MKTKTDTTFFSIYAQDRKGLLSQILMIFNRCNFPVLQLNAARTDIASIVLITLEASLPIESVPVLIKKIKKIIEIYQAKSYQGFEADLLQAGHYLVAKDFVDQAFFAILQKHGATIAGITTDGFVVQKTGTTMDLDVFYRSLDGPGLLSYCKSGLIVADSMVSLEELY